jgi:ankyrin repeat protein
MFHAQLTHSAACVLGMQKGNTPLHVAAQYGHDNVVKVLLGFRADASAKNNVSRWIHICSLGRPPGLVRMSRKQLHIQIGICHKQRVLDVQGWR